MNAVGSLQSMGVASKVNLGNCLVITSIMTVWTTKCVDTGPSGMTIDFKILYLSSLIKHMHVNLFKRTAMKIKIIHSSSKSVYGKIVQKVHSTSVGFIRVGNQSVIIRAAKLLLLIHPVCLGLLTLRGHLLTVRYRTCQVFWSHMTGRIITRFINLQSARNSHVCNYRLSHPIKHTEV